MEVVNIYSVDGYDVYGGRKTDDEGNLKTMRNTEPGKKGWLGNPYTLENHGREESIEKFESFFDNKFDNNKNFREEIKKLENKKVACFCKPKDCHLDVIKQKLEDLDES